ncbi:MAG: BspA family leucine-rich repeat surface protein, partial [Gammaproteobacteria bacterium]|nr:BspA family leucine-rich repeat surface protein [Gammaproteobacteria bacterium]
QVGQVTDFTSMFAGAEQFNKPLNNWSIKTKKLYGMFKGAKSFNQDIRGWNPPNIGDASYGYLVNGTAFTYDLSVWCLDNVVAAKEFSSGSPIAGQPDKQPRWLGSSCKAELPDVVQCSDLEGVEGGQWPNCTCEQGYEFNSTTNSCEAVTPEPDKTCLELGWAGGDPYPPCSCAPGSIWDQESLSCVADQPVEPLPIGTETICNGSRFVYRGRVTDTTYAQAWDQCSYRFSGSGLFSEEQANDGCLLKYLENLQTAWTSTPSRDGTKVRVLRSGDSFMEIDPNDLNKKYTAYCVEPLNPRPEFPLGTPADLDGDGTPNDQDPDIDGDGLTNDKDPDMDG